MTEHTHTPGPLSLRDDGYCDRLVAGDDRATIATGIVNRRNARLLAASYTSYDKHFGPNAIAAAEDDLLGEALEAVKAAALWFDEYAEEHYRKALNTPDVRERHVRKLKGKINADRAKHLRDVLAKAGKPEA